MRSRLSELLAEARRRGRAVCAFTCYDLEQAAGVLLAAEERGRGVVLLVSERSLAARPGRLLLSSLVAAADRSGAPAVVELDHARSLDPIRQAFALGAGAVMADGSRLPPADNAAFVRAAAAAGARVGGEVEAELGGLEGDEDVAAAAAAGALTDPAEAAAFARESGCACLAVSIGNVHGSYQGRPALDWERLRRIAALVETPLALHGASGLPKADLARAVQLGIAKVNVNTELRERYLETTAALLEQVRPGARLLDLHLAQVEAVAEAAAAKMAALEPG